MNTVKSFWLGWGSLCVAGGGAYYFAKKSINADRQARFEVEQKKRRAMEELEYNSIMESKAKAGANTRLARDDSSGSPSTEASSDPAPTRHAPSSETQRVFEKSKYEASEPYRSKKGDRLGG